MALVACVRLTASLLVFIAMSAAVFPLVSLPVLLVIARCITRSGGVVGVGNMARVMRVRTCRLAGVLAGVLVFAIPECSVGTVNQSELPSVTIHRGISYMDVGYVVKLYQSSGVLPNTFLRT